MRTGMSVWFNEYLPFIVYDKEIETHSKTKILKIYSRRVQLGS